MDEENSIDPRYVQFRISGLNNKADNSADGGGIRGYSSLLILRELMSRIAALEQKQEPRADCSVAPLEHRAIRRPARSLTAGTNGLQVSAQPELQVCSRFLPCHYFDFVAGTSTGG